MNAARLTLRKAEKLRHRSLVERLFREGESLYEFPLRLTWHILNREELNSNFRNFPPSRIAPLQMLVTVPKKKRKKAVDRVLMRRRIREAYRLNRLGLKEKVADLPGHGSLGLAFVYIHNENLDYALIEKKMKKLLKKVAECVTKEAEKEKTADTTGK